MAAGIPWSDDLRDGLLACVDHGGIDMPAVETRTERITGVINVHERKRARADAACSPQKYLLVAVCIRARLHGGLGQPGFLDQPFLLRPERPQTGHRMAAAAHEQTAATGPVPTVLGVQRASSETPLRGGTGMCGVCVLAKAVCELS